MSYLGPSLRRTRRRSRPWVRTASAVILSLALNCVLLRWVSVGGIVGPLEPRHVEEKRQEVSLSPLSAGQWAANRRAVTAPQAARPSSAPVAPAVPAPPPPPPEKPPAHGQVVDVTPSKDKTSPRETRFLSEEDNSVEKETRSRYRAPGYKNTLPEPSRGAQVLDQKTHLPGVAGGEGGGGAKRPAGGARPQAAPVAPRVPDRAPEKLALRQVPGGDVRMHEERSAHEGAGTSRMGDGVTAPSSQIPSPLGGGASPGVAGAPGVKGLQLRPSAATYERLAGGPAPDKLDGVEEGEGTFLNTRGWKYASYFNRIKRALAGEWDPGSAMRARDPTGARFGQHDWLTVLNVKLDEQGSLKDVSLQKSSGLDFLDSAAIQAFRRAQPFSNPPRGLADARGEIVFSFGFSFEVGGGFSGLFGRAPRDGS